MVIFDPEFGVYIIHLGIGIHALRIYYAVFGASNEIREDIVLLPRSIRVVLSQASL